MGINEGDGGLHDQASNRIKSDEVPSGHAVSVIEAWIKVEI